VSCHVNRALIIGGSSYVGRHLSSCLTGKYRVFSTFFSHKERIASGEAVNLDIRDSDSVKRIIETSRPELVYLLSYSLDDLEGTIVRGASHVMNAVKSMSSHLVFLSTDVVFGGRKTRYFEDDIKDHINEYGRAKSEAEDIVLKDGGSVVRTSLVYGFRMPDTRTEQLLIDLKNGLTNMAYFSDEFRCPIFIDDLCYMLAELANIDAPGTVHMTGPDCLSRLEFARKIASTFGFDINHVRPGSLKGSGLNRPERLCLDSSLIQEILNYRIRSLDEVLKEHGYDGNSRN
jgi:dTDP-4-dehydrorhamnose reductase